MCSIRETRSSEVTHARLTVTPHPGRKRLARRLLLIGRMFGKDGAVNDHAEKTMTVEFFFQPGTFQGGPLLEGMSGGPLSVTLLRGRITEADAWLRVQLKGSAQSIQTFLRLNRKGRLLVTAA